MSGVVDGAGAGDRAVSAVRQRFNRLPDVAGLRFAEGLTRPVLFLPTDDDNASSTRHPGTHRGCGFFRNGRLPEMALLCRQAAITRKAGGMPPMACLQAFGARRFVRCGHSQIGNTRSPQSYRTDRKRPQGQVPGVSGDDTPLPSGAEIAQPHLPLIAAQWAAVFDALTREVDIRVILRKQIGHLVGCATAVGLR